MSTRKKMSFVKSNLIWTLLNSHFSTPIRRISSALKTIFGSALRTMLALSSWVPVPTFSYVHTPSCHTSIQTCFVKNFWEKFSLNSKQALDNKELNLALGVMMSPNFFTFFNLSFSHELVLLAWEIVLLVGITIVTTYPIFYQSDMWMLFRKNNKSWWNKSF